MAAVQRWQAQEPVAGGLAVCYCQQVYHPNSAEVVILGLFSTAALQLLECALAYKCCHGASCHVALCTRGAPLKGLIVLQVGFEWSFDAWEDTRYTDHDRTVNILSSAIIAQLTS